jgi:hypothetical protein
MGRSIWTIAPLNGGPADHFARPPSTPQVLDGLLHENRPGSFVSSELIFATYQNAGLRVYDIKDQFRPKEVAAFVPPPPAKWVDPRPNRPIVLHSADVFVDKNALCYVTDFSAGLYIVEYKG